MLRAMAVVAHPDDCVIFARPFIDEHPDFEWSIVYLTYYNIDARAQEVSMYWNSRNIATKFLGFKDDYRDQEAGKLNFWFGLDAEVQLMHQGRQADLILTHDQHGDYGHIHHKVVHDAMQCVENVAKVYFANQEEANTVCYAKEPLDLDLLPLHREVIEQFSDINVGRYVVTDEARQLLKKVL